MINDEAPRKTALLTGGTGLLGRAIARDLLAHGWQVIVTTRAEANAADLRAAAGADGNGAGLHVVAFTVGADGDVAGLLDALAELPPVTGLVNNARSLDSLRVGADGVTEPAAFAAEFEMAVLFPYNLTMALANARRQTLRTVVNVGSQYGEVAPNPALYGGSVAGTPVQYGVSKAALHHLTRDLAARLAPQRIRVNCVAYGGVRGRADPAFVERYGTMLPLGRMIEPEEVPGPVRFLLSEDAAAVTGHVLMADGGYSIW